MFGYFALQLDSDPQVCEASDINDYRFGVQNLNHEERYIDIGFRFRLIFQVAFFSYLAISVIGSATYLVAQDTIRQLMFFILALMNYAVFFAWIFAFYMRL